MIDILVIRHLGEIEYFLFGDRHIRTLRLPNHYCAELVIHGVAVHSISQCSAQVFKRAGCHLLGGSEFHVVVCP